MHNERYNQSCIKETSRAFRKKIMVWGCFSGYGMGKLYKVDGILNAQQYIKILNTQMIPSAKEKLQKKKWIFQHDNDPKHKAAIVTDWLRRKKTKVMIWPPQSPDLNPIENLWSYLDRQIRDRAPKNDNELFTMLSKAWEAIPEQYIDSLIDSMPARCGEVIKNKGHSTKY